jgi:DHHC palmitoyltransferase/Ankyrin repeats (3 copies)/Ankyrin repeat
MLLDLPQVVVSNEISQVAVQTIDQLWNDAVTALRRLQELRSHATPQYCIDGNNDVIHACKYGDLSHLVAALENMDHQNRDHNEAKLRALHLAARRPNKPMVEALLRSGANALVRCDDAMESAAHKAVRGGDVDCLYSMVLHNNGKSSKDDDDDGEQHCDIVQIANAGGQTVIHVAAQHGDALSLLLLADLGADLLAADAQGMTALAWAAHIGHVACVRFLMLRAVQADDGMATLRAMLEAADARGMCAIHWAAALRRDALVAALVDEAVRRLGARFARDMLASKAVEPPMSAVELAQRNGHVDTATRIDRLSRRYSLLPFADKHIMSASAALFALVLLGIATVVGWPVAMLVLFAAGLAVRLKLGARHHSALLSGMWRGVYVATLLASFTVLWPSVDAAYALLAPLVGVVYVRLARSDAGGVRPAAPNALMRAIGGTTIMFCRQCLTLQPPRSSHCHDCARCVAVKDHHCKWIDQCIGARNKLLFVGFLALHVVAQLSFVLVAARHECAAPVDYVFALFARREPMQAPLVGALAAWHVVLGAWLSGLLCYYVHLALNNVTAREFYSQPLMRSRNPYSANVWTNVRQLCELSCASSRAAVDKIQRLYTSQFFEFVRERSQEMGASSASSSPSVDKNVYAQSPYDV